MESLIHSSQHNDYNDGYQANDQIVFSGWHDGLLAEFNREEGSVLSAEHVPEFSGQSRLDKPQVTHGNIGDAESFGAATFFHELPLLVDLFLQGQS